MGCPLRVLPLVKGRILIVVSSKSTVSELGEQQCVVVFGAVSAVGANQMGEPLSWSCWSGLSLVGSENT